MDEKTEELRELFVDVTDAETVTEQQENPRGSIADDGSDDGRLGDIVARMREEFGFDTSLSDDDLVTVVEGFYGGDSDTAIAEELGVAPDTVFRARLDLHLIRDRDADAPFDLADLRNLLGEDASTGDIAAELDVAPDTVRRYRRVLRAREEARSVSERFRSEFEDVVADADLTARLTTDMKEDGLQDATDGMETNVSF
ncbi:conditioned medium-induced protein 4 [Natronomonas halophila]|uniref:conditioned medium-induced protein 4 n=1 Tax=Natronomonas halophila TaxID=2747817 RepID=UPI0015B6FA6F|nr:conditioned medium-induced protein 4 [Natronomonas halophila]QLD85398.1 conditioned medium-induced protein 4 [Natronomonas halophila]